MADKKAVKFFNWTDEDFSHSWDGELYVFKAGETTTLPEGLALHFAKHAAVRELNKTETITDPQHLPPMMDKFLVVSEVEAESDKKLEVALLNDKKTKKKVVKKPKKKTKEEEFEGLKE